MKQEQKLNGFLKDDFLNLLSEIDTWEKRYKHEEKLENIAEKISRIIPLLKENIHYLEKQNTELTFEKIIESISKFSPEEREKISKVLADFLPPAITQEIKEYPQKIAVAIAPEIASSIEEQIRLEPHSIAKTLGPEMGKAIKNQIALEKDVMIDALYPIIGNTIARYMNEVIHSINQKVETALSIEGIKRKIRAKIRGVSEAELILTEVINYQVQAVFLIQKYSGLVLRELQTNLEQKLDSDMLAGMLTAIRLFINDCIVNSQGVSEVHEIEYGDEKIVLEVAGYCYLAVVIRGQPSADFFRKIRDIFSKIILQYSQEIENFNGFYHPNFSQIDEILKQLLIEKKIEKKSASFRGLLILIAILISGIFLPLSYLQFRHFLNNKLENKIVNKLTETPELSVYRIIPKVQGDRLILTGKVSNEYLKKKASLIAQTFTQPQKLILENQIVAVKLTPDPILAAAEVQRLTGIFNQKQGVAMDTKYENYTVTIAGIISNKQEVELITKAFRQIPGVDTIVLDWQRELPKIKTSIYFPSDSSEVNLTENSSKIEEIKIILAKNPQLHLKLIGYSDKRGEKVINRNLAFKRALNVQKILIDNGVEFEKLHIFTSLDLPLPRAKAQPLWLSRCVRFELFIPEI